MRRFILPSLRRITQEWAAEFTEYMGQVFPSGFYHSYGWHGHNGIDMGTPVGDPVYASGDGVVDYAGDGNAHPLMGGGGNVLILHHGDVRTGYLHLDRFTVAAGQTVKQGDMIAISGKTGNVIGAHLHFEFLPVSNTTNQNDGWRGRLDPGPWLAQEIEDDMGTVEAFTPEALNNLAVMVHGAVKEQLADVVKSVAFQERFSVTMLERIAAQSGVSIDAAAIATEIRAALAAQIGG